MSVGARLLGDKGLGLMLENLFSVSDKNTREVMRDYGERIWRRSRDGAPVLSGALTSAIQLKEKRRGSRGRMFIQIEVNPDFTNNRGVNVGRYMLYMHEGYYNLGPQSKKKQERTPFMVGRKFIERAYDHYYPMLIEDLEEAVDKALEAARRRAVRRGR